MASSFLELHKKANSGSGSNPLVASRGGSYKLQSLDLCSSVRLVLMAITNSVLEWGLLVFGGVVGASSMEARESVRVQYGTARVDDDGS